MSATDTVPAWNGAGFISHFNGDLNFDGAEDRQRPSTEMERMEQIVELAFGRHVSIVRNNNNELRLPSSGANAHRRRGSAIIYAVLWIALVSIALGILLMTLFFIDGEFVYLVPSAILAFGSLSVVMLTLEVMKRLDRTRQR